MLCLGGYNYCSIPAIIAAVVYTHYTFPIDDNISKFPDNLFSSCARAANCPYKLTDPSLRTTKRSKTIISENEVTEAIAKLGSPSNHHHDRHILQLGHDDILIRLTKGVG